ncbi:hypothetical protein PVAG01_08343 [Phlyctema vagabunda]|uniref:Fungal-type protein kinase domain-containing protein n=1 Tax=Phlyctema vagabunda TaxID=108571 RepID=A0ABR4P955_9HELO
MSSVFPLTPTEATLQTLRDDLKGNIIRNLDGFFAKYFEGKPWSVVVQNKLQEPESAKIVSKLSTGIAHFDALVEWLAEFQTLFFTVDQANFRFHSQSLSNTGGTARTGIYLETSDLQSVAGSTRVFGEFHHDNALVVAGDDNDDILRFCGRAQQVFKAQSARCFVHGFLVRGTTLELWVFDRSGAYSSKKLDLAQRPDLLMRALAGYTLMSDQEAGFNTFVKLSAPGSHSYVEFHQHDKFHLRPELVATADYIVGPGITCYVAATSTIGEPNTVIKFSWREDEEPTELSLLQRAHERHAWGVIQLIGYQDLVNIANLRQGLHFAQSFVNRTFSGLTRPGQGPSIPLRECENLQSLAKELHALIFPVRDGKIFTGTETDEVAVQRVYDGMAAAFNESALAFQC